MSKISVKNHDLVSAVKQASVSVDDTYVLTVLDKEISGSGMRQASLSCCNGSTQANIFIAVTADDNALGKYVFSKDFGGIVNTLAAYDDGDFEIVRQENGAVSISCGTAVVPVPVCENAVEISPRNPKENNAAQVVVKMDSLKEAIIRGGSSYSTIIGGAYEPLRNVINIVPEKNGDAYRLRIASSDGAMASGAYAPVLKQARLAPLCENELSLSLNATVFGKIMSVLKSEETTLYIMKEQVLLRDGYNIYIILPNATEFPAGVSKLLLTTPEMNYSFKVSKKRLLSAVEIALLNCGGSAANRKVICEVEDGTLSLQSVDGACHTVMQATEVTGSVRMGLNGNLLKMILSHMGDDILFYGTGAVSPIYISDGVEGSMSFLAPAVADAEDSDK
jgi:hypothetical protein